MADSKLPHEVVSCQSTTTEKETKTNNDNENQQQQKSSAELNRNRSQSGLLSSWTSQISSAVSSTISKITESYSCVDLCGLAAAPMQQKQLNY